MVIDSRIPLGIQQWKSADPMEMAGRAMQMQGLAQQGQLQQLKMDELARQRQQDAMLQGLAQQSGGDMRKLAKSLYDRGLVTQAMGIEDKLDARDKAAADASKTRADAGKAQFGLLRDGMAFLSRSPSDEAIVGTLGGMVRAGAIDPNMAEQFAGDLLRMPQADRARALAEAARTPEQLAAIYAPKVERIDNGQTIQFRDVNPMTAGQQDPVQRVMTPGEVAADRRGAQSNAISAGNLQVARDRLAFDQQNPRITNVVDTSAGLVGVDSRGNTRILGAPGGGMGPAGPVAAPGGLPGAGGGAGPAMPPQGQGGPVPQAGGAFPPGVGPAQPGQQQVSQQAGPAFLTKQQQAAQEAAAKASQRRQDALMSAETVMTAVDQALTATSGWTTGAIGATGAMVPGTAAYNLDATLDTLKANLSFDRLQQMREASATGGALGSVTERELDLLGSTIASLKQGQDPEQLRRNLQAVKTRYGRVMNNLRRIEAGETSVQPGDQMPAGIQPGAAMPPAGMAPAAPAYSGPAARVSGRIGGGPVSEGGAGQPAAQQTGQQASQRPAAGFTESRVAKWPMPSQVPVGTEIDLPDGRTMVNTGRAWEPKR